MQRTWFPEVDEVNRWFRNLHFNCNNRYAYTNEASEAQLTAQRNLYLLFKSAKHLNVFKARILFTLQTLGFEQYSLCRIGGATQGDELTPRSVPTLLISSDTGNRHQGLLYTYLNHPAGKNILKLQASYIFIVGKANTEHLVTALPKAGEASPCSNNLQPYSTDGITSRQRITVAFLLSIIIKIGGQAFPKTIGI